MYKLVISDDEGKTIIVPLVRDLITVGRQDGNTIRLTERNVSRQHARFVQAQEGYRLEDLGSYNGVTVNGLRIDEPTELKDGDRIGIGDYVIALRAEAATTTTTRIPTRKSLPGATHVQQPPPRLVMLSTPAPGAEFAINKPVMSIGRLEELDLCISHRSISREHARVSKKDDLLEIEDLRSANGVRVNGRNVKKVTLASGDVVELGQVRFRYVAAGESYTYDPSEEAVVPLPPARSGPRRQTVVALIGVAVIGAGLLALLQDGSRQAGAAVGREARVGEPEPLAPQAPEPTEPAPTASDDERRSAAIEKCRAGLASEQYAEALRAVDEVRGVADEGGGLAACKHEVSEAMRISAAYDQGTRALAENKLEDAYFLFAGIPDDHRYRARPEVRSTIEKVASERLGRARKALRTAPADARELAQSVLDMHDLPPPLREDAERVLAEANAPRPTGTTTATEDAGAVASAPKPKAPAAQMPRPEAEDPAKVAKACLARGDQRCVVRVLEGRAASAQELALLIETYRALGETKKAVKHMETFVTRFATARQTPQYRQFIAKHEQ